ncbi:MAG TPA: MCP four helix bundle domain-containing protein, partial [Pseudoxanthomonas sp.]|nr:MCP four helix bundle domain-containing protein [Pseudoxanthomonas sp.]
MKWFHDLPIARKLALSFAATTAMTVALGLFALWRLGTANDQIQETNTSRMPAVVHVGEMLALLNEYRTYELAQLGRQGQPEEIADYHKRIADTRGAIEAAEAAYRALPSQPDARERALYAEVQAARAAYFAAHDGIAAAVDAGDFAAAEAISGGESRKWRRQFADALKALTAYNVQRLDQQVKAAEAAHARTVAAIWAGILALGLLAALLGWGIARAVARPLEKATRVAGAIAQGRLDNAIEAQARDEAGQLLDSMRAMQAQLRAVLDAQREMAQQHDAGTVSFRMDESRFPGEYGEMIRGTNRLVGSHVDAILEMLEVVRRYSVGDLSVDIARMPGEKATMTEAVDAVKASLGAINAEIRRLAQAAAEGDFSARGDEQAYRHDFRVMVQGLNAMMA